jgi:hypothetical protein
MRTNRKETYAFLACQKQENQKFSGPENKRFRGIPDF